MAKPTYEVQKRWQDKAYKRYTVVVRKDTPLYLILQDYEGSVSGLIKDLLQAHFEESMPKI